MCLGATVFARPFASLNALQPTTNAGCYKPLPRQPRRRMQEYGRERVARDWLMDMLRAVVLCVLGWGKGRRGRVAELRLRASMP